jgi:hypothetical protein
MSNKIDFITGFFLTLAMFFFLSSIVTMVIRINKTEERPIVPILTKEERRILCN